MQLNGLLYTVFSFISIWGMAVQCHSDPDNPELGSGSTCLRIESLSRYPYLEASHKFWGPEATHISDQLTTS